MSVNDDAAGSHGCTLRGLRREFTRSQQWWAGTPWLTGERHRDRDSRGEPGRHPRSSFGASTLSTTTSSDAATLRTFSITFADAAFDESGYQERVANHLGVDHEVVACRTEQIAALVPKLVWHTEQPIVRTAPVPMMMLANVVQERGFKVVLTGEGADELFGGYDLFKEAKFRAEPELLEWWQEIFTTPCVAIGGITVENCARLVRAGADFLAVVSAVWDCPDGPAAAVRAFNEEIARALAEPPSAS